MSKKEEVIDPRDRRSHPRFEGHFQVDLLNMGDDPRISQFEAVVPGTALDVSLKGMRLKSMYHVEVGSLLSAIVYYKNQGSVCLCEVVWKREDSGEFLYGAFIKEWSQLDPDLAKQLKSMEKKQEAMSGSPSTPPTAGAVVTKLQLA